MGDMGLEQEQWPGDKQWYQTAQQGQEAILMACRKVAVWDPRPRRTSLIMSSPHTWHPADREDETPWRSPDHLSLTPFLPTGKPAEAGPHRAQRSGPRGSPPARKGECHRHCGQGRGRPGNRRVRHSLISPIVQLGWPQTGLAAGAVYQRRREGRAGFSGPGGCLLWGFPLSEPLKKQCHWVQCSLWFSSPPRRRDTKYFLVQHCWEIRKTISQGPQQSILKITFFRRQIGPLLNFQMET